MKANSVGLEIEILLSNQEIAILATQPLNGVLHFRDIHSDMKRQIPLTLKYSGGHEESIRVNNTPSKGYFGDAKSISIDIQDYFFDALVERGSCGDRFLSSGKVLIYSEAKHL